MVIINNTIFSYYEFLALIVSPNNNLRDGLSPPLSLFPFLSVFPSFPENNGSAHNYCLLLNSSIQLLEQSAASAPVTVNVCVCISQCVRGRERERAHVKDKESEWVGVHER